MKIKHKIQPDWWIKTLVGFILGLTLAIAMATILFFLAIPHVERNTVAQFAMWSIPWVWMFMFFIAYFIPKGWHSLLIFSLANILAYILMFWLRG